MSFTDAVIIFIAVLLVAISVKSFWFSAKHGKCASCSRKDNCGKSHCNSCDKCKKS